MLFHPQSGSFLKISSSKAVLCSPNIVKPKSSPKSKSQIQVPEFYQESTGHVGFILALLLANQWEAKNPNFLAIWPTDKYEGSKWLNVYCQDLV